MTTTMFTMRTNGRCGCISNNGSSCNLHNR